MNTSKPKNPKAINCSANAKSQPGKVTDSSSVTQSSVLALGHLIMGTNNPLERD